VVISTDLGEANDAKEKFTAVFLNENKGIPFLGDLPFEIQMMQINRMQ